MRARNYSRVQPVADHSTILGERPANLTQSRYLRVARPGVAAMSAPSLRLAWPEADKLPIWWQAASSGAS
jgi:hypothetical protein